LAAELAQFFEDQDALGVLATSPRQRPPAGLPAGPAPGGGAAELGQLGDFRIVRQVGRGGMGVVYEAEQLSLRRRVALKVLPFAATLDARQLQRFHNEAQAAACLHHTHIVPVYFVGCAGGVPFYAMQLIDGQPLSAIIRQLRQAEKNAPTAGEEHTGASQPPPGDAASTTPVAAVTPLTGAGRRGRDYFRKVAELGMQAAEALAHAHQLGIVHRDIKPGNLLLDGRGSLWVTDFGLAHCQSQAGLTMTGDLVGTLRYMSPEQTLGQRGLVDHRTDVYSLGVTLYELLTLEPAFAGQDRQELLRQIASEEPRPPRRLNQAIPAELETIVLKALEKEPARRYATAQDLADDLRRFLEDRPIRARPVGSLERAWKWARRRPAHAALAGAIAVAVLACMSGGFLYGLYQDQRAEMLRRLVERGQAVGKLWTQGQGEEADGRLDEAARSYDRALATLDADPGAAPEDLRPQIVGRRGRVRLLLEERAGRQQVKTRAEQFTRLRDDLVFQAIDPTGRDRAVGRQEVRRLAPAALAVWGVEGDDPPGAAVQALEGQRRYFEPPRRFGEVAAGCYEVLLVWAEAEAEPVPGEEASARQARS
jgi:serine/threonine protein kinase